MIRLIRFFVVAPPVAPLTAATFVFLAAVGAAVLVADATRGAEVVMPIVVLQLFASASGFEGPARRGHYDLLLTGGEGRVRVALAHWAASAAPGVAAVVSVGVMEGLASGGTRRAVLSGGTLAAFCLVSTVPWAAAVRLPRFAPSIGWILLLALAPALAPVAVGESMLRNAASGSPISEAAVAFLLYPLAIVGHPLSAEGAPVIGLALAVGAGGILAALWWISDADVPLETAQ